MNSSYYITTPIYYVNDAPHIGHAYTTLACDVLARFKRLDGYQVKFLTGTDEHGQKVDKAAQKEGVDPQSFTDKVSMRFRELADRMEFSHDDFIRTTEPRHKKAAQALWKRLAEKGKGEGGIYLDSYAGWYSVRDEAFYAEAELQDGKAPTGAEVEWVEEESYFFELSYWQEKLLAFYEGNPEFILPKSRRNEVISFVKGGLKDLSISRTSFSWGIPVPGDEKHVMYVWLDALTNYLSALGFPDSDAEDFKTFWPANVHIVGKDILRFHAVYWPAFLMAAGIEVPQRIFAHGWWTNEGEKISKSIGNVIDPLELVDTFGLDQTRYHLMAEVPFGNDGNFMRAGMIHRLNSDLANNIGNLVQRTLSMIQKNCDGKVPECDQPDMEGCPDTWIATIREHIDQQQIHLALQAIVAQASRANEYIDEKAPWKLKNDNIEQMYTVLYTLAEVIRCLGIILQPFMPSSAAKILDQLAVPEDQRSFTYLDSSYRLQSGTVLPKPEGIFPRFDKEA